MIRRFASVLILTLAAAAAARADDASAPLADTKRQLLQLQKDETAAKAGTGESSLKAAMPGLQTTLQGREALPTTILDPGQAARVREQKRKELQTKNWLVDAYNQLDPNAAKSKKDESKIDLPPAEHAADNEGPPDQSDPRENDDLIKIFATQTNSSTAPAAKEQKLDGLADRGPTADPLAPFLQSWLANSPVRDAALAGLPKVDGAATGPAPESIALDAPTAPADGRYNSLAGDGSGSSPENPYLLNVTLPTLPETSPTAAPAAVPGALDSLLNPPPDQPVQNSQVDKPVSPARDDQFKPPPTPADEDKKYFPQLKRF